MRKLSMGSLAALAAAGMMASSPRGVDIMALELSPEPTVKRTRPRAARTKSKLNTSGYFPHFGQRQIDRLARNIALGRIPADQRA